MIPILFAPTATNFTSNGLGRMTETISAEVTEQRNGSFEMALVYPITGRFYGTIGNGHIIGVKPSPSGSLQAFRVYKISRPINGRITYYCRHISYQLSFIPVAPFTASTLAAALSGLASNAMESCPFTFTADFTSSASYAIALPGSIRSYLGGKRGSIIDVYGNGAEWEFNNYACTLHAHRGQNRGVVLRYGKQITDLKQEENIENTITGIVPFWQSEETRVVLPAPVSSPVAANFPFPRTVVKDWSDKWENAPTQAAMQAAAESYVSSAGIGVPSISIDVNFVALADTMEYKDLAPLETVELCDTVAVYFEKLGVTNYAGKVIETSFDVLRERYNSIKIGDARHSLADTITDTIDEISIRPTVAEAQRSIDRATGVLNSGTRGHVIIDRNPEGWANQLYFVDNENIYSAVKVLRINMGGIGFSSSGINGEYAQSWTLDGKLTLGGINNAYGDLLIRDENGIPTIQVDKDGLKLWKIEAAGYLYNGVLYADSQHTTVITPTVGLYYFDLVTYVVYGYENGQYSQVTDNEGLLAKMTRDGLGLYEGDIDLKWNGQTGLKFTAGQSGSSDTLQIGDFMVSSQDNNGRQILESTDEMTGMSGEPEEGQYFLWAGWRSDSDFAFAVENQGGGGADNVVINGTLYVNGVDVMDYISEMSVGDEEVTEGGVQYEGIAVDLGGTPTPVESWGD